MGALGVEQVAGLELEGRPPDLQLWATFSALALPGADVRGWAGAQGGRPSGGEEPGLVIPLATEGTQQLATEGTQQLAEAVSGGSEAICLGGPFCLPSTILHWYSGRSPCF